jgi:20S proteasome alpha/beta subunit
MRVGLVKYNNKVNLYNIKGCIEKKKMMVVGDVKEMFMNIMEGFMCDKMEYEDVIDRMMEKIKKMFEDNSEKENVLDKEIKDGIEEMKE